MQDTIDVRLEQDQWNQIVGDFVEKSLRPESIQVYRDALATGETVKTAVYDAIRNEAVNDILEAKMNGESNSLTRAFDQLTKELTDYQNQSRQPTRTIFVTFQKEGIHRYPDAGTNPTLATGDWDDVSFLASPHRHIFHFRVQMEVFHDDRDVEFIQLKRWCERLYSEGTLSLDYKSCEMISDDLYEKLIERFPGREMMIEVSEDGENGSQTFYDAE